MAGLSIHERYGRSQYTFPWKQRDKWLLLLNRFHLFSPTWAFRAWSEEKKDYVSLTFSTNSESTARELQEHAANPAYKIRPDTNVTVNVHGNGFWGAMPFADQIDWSKLPPERPDATVPATVTRFVEILVEMSHVMGVMNDMGYMWELDEWEKEPISDAWFPYILGAVRAANPKLVSFFFAPSKQLMYLLFQDDEDALIVRFNGSRAAPCTDPRFDLDDGFVSEVPEEMKTAFNQWAEETDRDARKPLLTLLGPYEGMLVRGNKLKRAADTKEKKRPVKKAKTTTNGKK